MRVCRRSDGVNSALVLVVLCSRLALLRTALRVSCYILRKRFTSAVQLNPLTTFTFSHTLRNS